MRRTRRSALLAAALLGALAPGLAAAQREGYTYLSWVSPDVSLVSSGDEDTVARANTPVLAGDAVVTGNAARAEAVLADGTIVRLDARAELRFDRLARTYESDDDRTILSLVKGAVSVEVRDFSTRDRSMRLDTDDATILAPARALFRVDVSRRGTELYVLGGRVEVNGRSGRALVKAGEYAFVSGEEEIEVEAADVPRDRFTRFVEERRGRADGSDVSRYVGSDYAYDAADLEDAGSWSYVASSGTWGWRPRVDAGWSPYALGTWRWTPAGLTWVSYEPWGWLPYHYGTWAFDDTLGWCWIPADAYSPAWVAWSYGDDWTGWCPMGWISGPYYAPYYGSYPRSTRVTYGNERGGPWAPQVRGRVEVTQIDRRGWTFVPTARIGTRLETRDVTRGDRVPFPRGETVLVSSAPLRTDRGVNPAQVVRDTVRRGATTDRALDPGLTSILRRDRTLDATAREELRRALRPGPDTTSRVAASDVPRARERVDAWRAAGDRPPRPSATGDRAVRSRSDEGWRASSTIPPTRVERRDADRRDRQGDSGWRAPSPRVIERSSERPIVRSGDAPARHEPVRSSPAVSAPAPMRAAPASPPPSAPAPHRDR